MKTPLLALLASALVLGAGVSSAAGPTPRTPLRPTSDCLVARQVLDWGVVDDRRLVVKSLGKRYYDIQLTHRCRDLNRRPYLTFRDGMQPTPRGPGRGYRGASGDPLTSDGRICGDLGDAVIPVGGVRDGFEVTCRIGNIRRIDENTFESVFGRDSRSANALLDSAPTVNPRAVSR